MKFLIYPATAILALTVAGSAFAMTCEDRYQAMGQNRPHDWNAFQAQCELSSTGGGNGGAATGMAIPRPIQHPVAAAIDNGTAAPIYGSGAYHETYAPRRDRERYGEVDGMHGQWTNEQNSRSDAYTNSMTDTGGASTGVGRSGAGGNPGGPGSSGGEAGARG